MQRLTPPASLPDDVVFVCTNYFPRVTGVGVVLEGWARRLAGLGVRTTVVAPSYPDCPYYPPHNPPAYLRVVRLPSRPVPLAPGLRVMKWSDESISCLVGDLRGGKVLVHAQDPLNAGAVGAKLAKLAGAPLVTHIHSPVFGRELRDWLGAAVGRAAEPLAHHLVRRAVARVFQASKRVVAVTEYVARKFADRGFAPLEVLPCGIEAPVPECLVPDVRAAHGIPSSGPLLLYVGRLEPDKGVGELLRAFSLVLQAVPDAFLLLVGGGALIDRYRKTAVRLGIHKRTVFAGWRRHCEVWSYYRQADIFVIANADEAQGLVALEAQACGLPVVGYKTGGIGLVVRGGETGLLSEPNPHALAHAIVRLCTDRDLRRGLGARGPGAAAMFSADKSFSGLPRIYERALLAC
ncbi:MAG: glycosyltransferase [Armatimonadota bacterium]